MAQVVKKQYVSKDGQWVEVPGGVGEHTHADYLPLTGGTIAPGPLTVPAPGAAGGAARYVDGIPRFPDTAARDTFYATLPGGPQAGMQCYVVSLGLVLIFDGVAWVSLILHTGRQHGDAVRSTTASLTKDTPYDTSFTTYGPGAITPPDLERLDSTQGGVVTVDQQQFLVTIYAAFTAPAAAATIAVTYTKTTGGTTTAGSFQYFYVNPSTVHSDFRINYAIRVGPGAGVTIGSRFVARSTSLTMTYSNINLTSI